MLLDWCGDVLGSWVLKSSMGGLVSSVLPQALILAFKALHVSPHAWSPNVCNLWKLIQGSFTPTPPMDYFESPHGPTLHQSKDIFLSSPMPNCYFSTIQRPSKPSSWLSRLCTAHAACSPNCYFSTIQAVILAFMKFIQGSFTPTPPLDYFEGPHGPTSLCHGIGHHCAKARTFPL